jgi:hypothetical protein
MVGGEWGCRSGCVGIGVRTYYPLLAIPHPHNPQLAKPFIFFRKKRDSFFRRLTTPLVLSAAAGRIKGSCWHPQTAHHLALRWLPCIRR